MKAKRKFIPVEESFADWLKDPEYRAAYDALEQEFSEASAAIRAGQANPEHIDTDKT